MKTRTFLAGFKAYEWETSTRDIAASVGLPARKIYRLDTNTSPFIPVGSLKSLREGLLNRPVNQYPDTSYLSLRLLLSSYCGKDADRFVVINGADEGLDIIVKTFLNPGEEAIVATPTYSMFRVVTEIMDGRLVAVRRENDFSVNVDSILERVGEKTRLIFLCNPNNPTGNLTPVADVERLAKGTGAVVAVDEAYFEYGGKSAIDLTDRYDNLVVVRTFSKAFSMAGVRVGYLVALRSTVAELNKVRPPNSLTVLSLSLAEYAIKDLRQMRQHVATIVKERERCFSRLSEMKQVKAHPSLANFILFRVKKLDGNLVHSRMMKKGFVLRNLVDVPGIENSLRVTMSTPQVNDAFMDALGASLAP